MYYFHLLRQAVGTIAKKKQYRHATGKKEIKGCGV
jgi:hypothetical protein